jgi:hypothetical protein
MKVIEDRRKRDERFMKAIKSNIYDFINKKKSNNSDEIHLTIWFSS